MKKLTIFASIIVLSISLIGCGKTASSKTEEIVTVVKEPIPAQTETTKPAADIATSSDEAVAETSEPVVEVQAEESVSINPMSVDPDDYFVNGIFDMDAYAIALGYETCYTDNDEPWAKSGWWYTLHRDGQEFYFYGNDRAGVCLGYYANGKTLFCASNNLATDDIVTISVRNQSLRMNLAYSTFLTAVDLLAYATTCDTFVPSEAPFYQRYGVDVFYCEPAFRSGKFFKGDLENYNLEESFHSDTGNYPLD